MVDGEHTEEEPFRVRIPPKWIEVELIWQDGLKNHWYQEDYVKEF